MAEDTLIADEETTETEETTEDTILTADSEDKSDTQGDDSSDADAKDDEGDKEDKPSDEVPETYEFTVPDGMEIDTVKAEEFSAIAKDASLTQAQADSMVGLYIKSQQDMMESQTNAWKEQLTTWKEEATNDTEIGGVKFQTTVGNAKKALDVFGNEKLKEALNTSGMGNHPELIRMLNKVGEAASNDSFVFGKESGAQKRTPAEILFPNQGKA